MTNIDPSSTRTASAAAAGFDWTAFVDPTLVFDDPEDVLRARDLSVQEKRAILASWASDAYAVESQPVLRNWPGSSRPVPVTQILAALASLAQG